MSAVPPSHLSPPQRQHPATAWIGLATGALVWGLIWYPYRVLEGLGLSGVAATVLTYTLALILTLVLLPSAWRGVRPRPILLAIALAAGSCNLGYVVAMLDGQVMRVLLLFYLSPFWTVLLSRMLLAERLSVIHGGVVLLSLAGAVVMLWRPDLGPPLPASQAEWIGLAAGFCFALSNVLSRRANNISEETRSLAMFLGSILVGLMLAATGVASLDFNVRDLPLASALALAIGVTLFSVNMAVQYGLATTPANRASVILLTELAVAAVGAWLLATEVMGVQEMLGGAMIVAASLLAIRLGGH